MQFNYYQFAMNKPRVVKDYDKLDAAIQEQIKLYYVGGFETELITFKNAEGKNVSALPFEAEDKYYLVRMTISEAQDIIEDDDDYDDDGMLKEEVKEAYEEKYDDIELDSADFDDDQDDQDDEQEDDKDKPQEDYDDED